MSILTKKDKKKTEIKLPREEFLQLKPVRNSLLKWSKSKEGKVVITLSVEKSKGVSRILSKFVEIPKEKQVKLDKLGTFVWEMCDGRHTVAEIARKLGKEYKMTRQDVEVSLSSFLQNLAKRKFIELAIPEEKAKEEGPEKELRIFRRIKIP